MPSHFKVHELLTRSELDALEAFAREPGRTVDECFQWMLERGFTLSRSAVGTWKQAFDGQLLAERFSNSGELAKALKGAIQGGNFDDIAEAAVMQLTQVVFESSAALQSGGGVDPLDVQRMTRSLNNLIGGKAGLMKIVASKFERETRKMLDASPGRTLTEEQIGQAAKAVFGV